MISDAYAVRSTNPSYRERKNHMFAALVIGLVAALLILVVWLAVSPSTLYPVQVNGKFGYINKSAKMVIAPQFEQALAFREGYAPVKVGGNWGYIDKSGKLTISPQYHLADPFSSGLALVGVGPRLGYI